MAKSESVRKIQSIIDSIPFTEIIETAESIAPLIPAIGGILDVIIKILKVLFAIKPTASKAAGIIAQQGENDLAAKRETFNRMWTIALSDNIITPEEKDFLRPYAIEAGIPENEFELMVLNKININQ